MRIKGTRVVDGELYLIKNVGGAVTAISGELVAVTNALLGYLSNETEMLRSLDTAGHPLVDPTELNSAGGTFTVKDGSSDVTQAAETSFRIPSSANGGIQVFTTADSQYVTKSGLRFEIKTSGANKGIYALSQPSANSWNSDSEQFAVEATYGEASVTRIYKISKNPGGTDLNLSYDNAFFNLKKNPSTQAWEAVNSNHKITFKAGLLGFTSNPPNVTWEVYGLSATDVATVNPIQTATTAGAGTYLTVANETGLTRATMLVSQFLAGKSATYESLRIKATCGNAYDEFTVRAAFDGAKGDTGDAGVVVTLSNDPHTISARDRSYDLLDANDLTSAGGFVKVYLGGTDITSQASTVLSISGGSGAGPVTKTQNDLVMTLTTTGDDKGKYALTQAAGKSWTTRTETFDITATVAGTTYTRTYTINKTLSPVTVSLSAAPPFMALTSSGAVKNANANIVIKPTFTNKPTGTVTWTVKKIKDPDDDSQDAAAASGTLSGTGDTRSVTPAKFVENFGGGYIGLRVTASITTNSITTSDEVVILATQDGPQGEKGNDGATGPAGPAGVGVGDYVELALGKSNNQNTGTGLELSAGTTYSDFRQAILGRLIKNTNAAMFTVVQPSQLQPTSWDQNSAFGATYGVNDFNYIGTKIKVPVVDGAGTYRLEVNGFLKVAYFENMMNGSQVEVYIKRYDADGNSDDRSDTVIRSSPVTLFPNLELISQFSASKVFAILGGESFVVAFRLKKLVTFNSMSSPIGSILADDACTTVKLTKLTDFS